MAAGNPEAPLFDSFPFLQAEGEKGDLLRDFDLAARPSTVFSDLENRESREMIGFMAIVPFMGLTVHEVHDFTVSILRELDDFGQARRILGEFLLTKTKTVLKQKFILKDKSEPVEGIVGVPIFSADVEDKETMWQVLEALSFRRFGLYPENPLIATSGHFASQLIEKEEILIFVHYYYPAYFINPKRMDEAVASEIRDPACPLPIKTRPLFGLPPLSETDQLMIKVAFNSLLDLHLSHSLRRSLDERPEVIFSVSDWWLELEDYSRTAYEFILPLARQMRQVSRWLEASLANNGEADFLREEIIHWRRQMDLAVEFWVSRADEDDLKNSPPPAEIPTTEIGVEEAGKIFTWVRQVLDNENWYPRPKMGKDGGETSPFFVWLPKLFPGIPRFSLKDLPIVQMNGRLYIPNPHVWTEDQLTRVFASRFYREAIDWPQKEQIFEEIGRALEEAGVPSNEVVLDVGTGPGWLPAFVNARKVYGLDISLQGLRQARMIDSLPDGQEVGQGETIIPLQANAKKTWPVASESMGAVVLSFVEQWLESDWQVWYSEAYRALKVGGVLVMNLYHAGKGERGEVDRRFREIGFQNIQIYPKTISSQKTMTVYKEWFVVAVK